MKKKKTHLSSLAGFFRQGFQRRNLPFFRALARLFPKIGHDRKVILSQYDR
jgi:hypothetical protein